eukprot:3676569-Rhodomonas_salina.1
MGLEGRGGESGAVCEAVHWWRSVSSRLSVTPVPDLGHLPSAWPECQTWCGVGPSEACSRASWRDGVAPRA